MSPVSNDMPSAEGELLTEALRLSRVICDEE